MELLQRWVLLLCCGAVLYGAVENLLPRQGVFPVIKMTAILYIVLILLSPVKHAEKVTFELPELPQGVSVQTDEMQQAVLKRSALLLKEELSEALRADGQDVQVAGLTVSETDGTVHVLLYAGEHADRTAAEQLCNERLGVKGNYEWKDG